MVSVDIRNSVDALTLYNLPYSATEDYIYSLFPAAQQVNLVRGSNDPTSAQSVCILKFNSPHECQKAYAECQGGKEVAGRMLHAELGESHGSSQRATQGGGAYRSSDYGGQDERRSSDSGRPDHRYSSGPHQESDKNGENGCNLTVSNLPYSASERDVWNEFPEALKVVLTLDERGRSRGVAQISFSTKEECNAAYQSCNYKMLNGRPIRGRITRDGDNNGQRDFGNRQGRYNDGQRDFGGGRSNRYNDDRGGYGGGGRQGRFNDDQRDFGGRQGSQGNYNRDRDNRYGNFGGSRGGSGGGGGGYRGGGGGNQGYGGGRGRGGPNRFGNRDDRGDSFGGRRDRSPGRDEPVRGYGNNKGPRITSAVISRPGGISPQSSSSSSGED